jgi:hypothetical protein
VWELLASKWHALPGEDEQQKAAEVLIEGGAGLLEKPALTETVLQTWTTIADEFLPARKALVSRVLHLLTISRERLGDQVVHRLEVLNERLAGSDFHSQLRRFVGMGPWQERLDANNGKASQQRLQGLAKTALEQPQLLRRELKWLLSNEAESAFLFGYELSKLDQGFSRIPDIIEEQRVGGDESSGLLLSGYLRGVFEIDAEAWEQRLDAMAGDEVLARRVPELTWRSGLSDRAAERVMNLVQRGIVSPLQFRLWRWGQDIERVSEPIFRQWLALLLDQPDEQADLSALELFFAYYCSTDQRKPPLDLAMRLLLNDSLFAPDRDLKAMSSHSWTEIAKWVILYYPDAGLDLLESVLTRWGQDSTFFARAEIETWAVLDQVVIQSPQPAWRRIAPLLDNVHSFRTHMIMTWLQGTQEIDSDRYHSLLTIIPPQLIWEWVDDDRESRACLLAAFVPKTLDPDNGGSLTRELLIRYGDRESVRRALHGNLLLAEGWIGSESEHFQRRKDAALCWRKVEKNERVRLWLAEYIEQLDGEIAQARGHEEREDW